MVFVFLKFEFHITRIFYILSSNCATHASLTLSNFHALSVFNKQSEGGMSERHKSQLQCISQLQVPNLSL